MGGEFVRLYLRQLYPPCGHTLPPKRLFPVHTYKHMIFFFSIIPHSTCLCIYRADFVFFSSTRRGFVHEHIKSFVIRRYMYDTGRIIVQAFCSNGAIPQIVSRLRDIRGSGPRSHELQGEGLDSLLECRSWIVQKGPDLECLDLPRLKWLLLYACFVCTICTLF